MKKTVEETAARFSEKAGDYDESKSDEYHACAALVVEHAAPTPDDVVLDLGTGTGAIALGVAPDARRVLGRDISEGMLTEARQKAEVDGIDNVEFGTGRFREPNVEEYVDTESSKTPREDAHVDVVVSNYAMHHLDDEEKREAIDVIASLGPRRFVLGDVMLFSAVETPYFNPENDDPATVGFLADALTDAGFALTAVERVHDQV
ncbi:MAG: class I SAM-dependent methyltransferase, partial [Halobacteriota archaeon]